MESIRHHLLRALAWTVVCVLAQQAGAMPQDINYLPKTMKTSLDYLKSKMDKNDMTGGALFYKHLERKDHQISAQFLIAGETLRVFEDILVKMKEKSQDATARLELDNLGRKITELKTKYFSSQENELKVFTKTLEELQKINVSDELVQHKAIFELQSVYNRASSQGIASKSFGQLRPSPRRRRQTRRQAILKP